MTDHFCKLALKLKKKLFNRLFLKKGADLFYQTCTVPLATNHSKNKPSDWKVSTMFIITNKGDRKRRQPISQKCLNLFKVTRHLTRGFSKSYEVFFAETKRKFGGSFTIVLLLREQLLIRLRIKWPFYKLEAWEKIFRKHVLWDWMKRGKESL